MAFQSSAGAGEGVEADLGVETPADDLILDLVGGATPPSQPNAEPEVPVEEIQEEVASVEPVPEPVEEDNDSGEQPPAPEATTTTVPEVETTEPTTTVAPTTTMAPTTTVAPTTTTTSGAS